MSKIKHRTLVHIALNAKGERVGALVYACGRFIPMSCPKSLFGCRWRNRSSLKWTWVEWMAWPSVADWKEDMRINQRAVRFQRVMLVGD